MTNDPDDTRPANLASKRHLRLVHTTDVETDDGNEGDNTSRRSEPDLGPESILHPDHEWHHWLLRARREDLDAAEELLADPQVRASYGLDHPMPSTRALRQNLLILDLTTNLCSDGFIEMILQALGAFEDLPRMESQALPDRSAVEIDGFTSSSEGDSDAEIDHFLRSGIGPFDGFLRSGIRPFDGFW